MKHSRCFFILFSQTWSANDCNVIPVLLFCVKVLVENNCMWFFLLQLIVFPTYPVRMFIFFNERQQLEHAVFGISSNVSNIQFIDRITRVEGEKLFKLHLTCKKWRHFCAGEFHLGITSYLVSKLLLLSLKILLSTLLTIEALSSSLLVHVARGDVSSWWRFGIIMGLSTMSSFGDYSSSLLLLVSGLDFFHSQL